MDPIGISSNLISFARGIVQKSEQSDMTAKFMERMLWVHGSTKPSLMSAGGAYMPIDSGFQGTLAAMNQSTRSKFAVILEKATHALEAADGVKRTTAAMGGFKLVSAGPG